MYKKFLSSWYENLNFIKCYLYYVAKFTQKVLLIKCFGYCVEKIHSECKNSFRRCSSLNALCIVLQKFIQKIFLMKKHYS